MRKILGKTKLLISLVSLVVIPQLINFGVQAQVMDASFELSPSKETLTKECPSRVDIMINTGNNFSNAANIILKYDPDDISITDSNESQSGIQIETGEAYAEYTDNFVDINSGTIRLTGYTLDSIKGAYRFGSIHFEPKTGANGTDITIQFDGQHNTHDSNIAELNTSDDILASVANGTYTFETGSCFEDDDPPIIEPINPKNFEVDVAKDGKIIVDITDVNSGVDITTVKITINGVAYTHKDKKNFSYTGSPGKYTITIIPKDPFEPDTPVYVIFRAADFSGNWATASILFNVPPEACGTNNQINQLNEELDQCKNQLSGCTGTDIFPSLPITGIGDISQYLGISCMFYFIPLLIIFFHPYWRNPKDNDLLRKITKEKGTIPAILFVVGFLISLFGLFDCFSILTIINIVLYVSTLIQVFIRKRLSDEAPETVYE